MAAIEAAARAVHAPLTVMGVDFDAWADRGGLSFQDQERFLDLPAPALSGPHQVDNAGLAVAVALELDLPETAIAEGLRAVRWPARMQRLTAGPYGDAARAADAELWLDGGHNPAAGDMIADTLAGFEEKAPKPVYLVVGMMGQKDALGFLAPFRGLVRGIYTVPIPGAHETPHSQETLAEVAQSAGLQAIDREGVIAALQTIAALPKGPKRVLICGSLYLAGHVLTLQESGV